MDAIDAFAACFPAGTLSGAPKVRAMQIIEELEPTRPRSVWRLSALRGLCGESGFLHCHPHHDDEREESFICRWSAGIVADSDSAKEFDECMNKGGAVLRAVEKARNG